MKKRLRKTFIRLAALVLCIALFFSVVLIGHHLIASARLKSALAALAEDNIPVTYEEWRTFLLQQNPQRIAKTRLWAAFDALGDVPILESDDSLLPIAGLADAPAIDKPMPTEMVAALRRLFDQLSPAMDDLRKAIDEAPTLVLPESDMYADRSWFTARRISSFRHAARLFAMESLLHSATNDGDFATEDVIYGIELGRILDTQPSMVNRLVQLACDGLSIQSLAQVLARTNPSQEKMKQLASLLVAGSEADGLLSLMGEVVYTTSMYGEFRSNREELQKVLQGSQRMIAGSPGANDWLRVCEVYQLRVLHDVIKAWGFPWQDFKLAHDTAMERQRGFYVMEEISPSILKCFRSRNLESQGRFRAARLALAIEAYGQSKGKLPKTAEELVPDWIEEVPLDPFTREPLKYEATNGAGRIYFSIPGKYEPWEFLVTE